MYDRLMINFMFFISLFQIMEVFHYHIGMALIRLATF